ncbi:hypothetical protein [Natronorubrum thiooxidans]|uniref:Uncharacterized protein n=1 Tax=Natronorubrum thiooxidans TaxID=308853 RepID=A0A1N7F6E4_9EURY|nr:hypothetical protein [Natronorubrum thiooxidans]SIR95893.1 hypothetical protein SAMN05421752_10622 [Natronorubrum thiooxidans]
MGLPGDRVTGVAHDRGHLDGASDLVAAYTGDMSLTAADDPGVSGAEKTALERDCKR